MLVDGLPLVVVVRVKLAIRAGDRLRVFVRLEAAVERLFASSALVLAEAAIAQHQVVVRLEIFRIDRQYALEGIDAFLVLPLQEEHAPELVEDDSVSRVARRSSSQVVQRFVVAAQALERG